MTDERAPILASRDKINQVEACKASTRRFQHTSLTILKIKLALTVTSVHNTSGYFLLFILYCENRQKEMSKALYSECTECTVCTIVIFIFFLTVLL